MGERLSSDDARCSTQIAESALVTDLVSGHIGGVQIYLICAPLGLVAGAWAATRYVGRLRR